MKKELKGAANAVEEASNSRALVIAARAGFAVSGLLHVLIGSVAIQPERPTDGDGVSSIPARPVLDNEIAEHRPSPVGGCRGDIR